MLSKSQQTILDLILGEVAGTTRGNFVSGRFLRGKLKGILPPDLLARDLAELQPAYISSWGTGRQDNYAPPFDGLLASSHADHAKAALLTILRTWIAKRVDDVEFRMFSWPEVKQAMPPGADQDQARDATELLFFDFVAKLRDVVDQFRFQHEPRVIASDVDFHIDGLYHLAIKKAPVIGRRV